jgi:VanZ family protein
MPLVSPLAHAARRAPAPLVLMALIFVLSAQPDLDTGLGVWDTILRKLAHAVAFGGLAVLWWWALRPAIRNPLALAGAIALLYSISDEYHQSFVGGRSGTPTDVAIDLVGIVIALLLLRYDRRVLSVLEQSGGSPDRRVAMPGDRRPADGPSRRTRGPARSLRGRGDDERKGRPPAPD